MEMIEQNSSEDKEMLDTTYSEEFKNVSIYTSNSELDGINEGDGDLLRRLTEMLNNYGISAKRIIQNTLKIPRDMYHLLGNGQLLSLCTEGEVIRDVQILQDRFFDVIDKDKAKTKIVYIGSRINVKSSGTSAILGESGSLFDKDFINRLKAKNVKIVVCCLEYKFFRRSANELKRLYHMIKQQLFLADGIHFLTEPDQIDFNETMQALQKGEALAVVSTAITWINNKERSLPAERNRLNQLQDAKKTNEIRYKTILDKMKSKDTSEQEKETLEKERQKLPRDIRVLETEMETLKLRINLFESIAKETNRYNFLGYDQNLFSKQTGKAVFISGIYTVKPLLESEISLFAEKMKITGNNTFEILSNREPNILHFGIIRGEKGIDEAIELSLKLRENKENYKVIIAGKLMFDLKLLYNIFIKIFDMQSLEFYKNLQVAIKEIIGREIGLKEIKEFVKVEKIINSEGRHEEFNNFCIKFYEQLATKHRDKLTNIEFHFNVNEEEIKILAMRCKYAIKLDHKGMANNASTIASCLGFYLPVISTCGLVTNKEFINFELAGRFLNQKYQGAVIMPEEEYYVNEKTGEVKPINPTVESVYTFLKGETEKSYLDRLKILQELYKDGTFSCEEVTKQLIDKIFLPLSKGEELNFLSQAVITESEDFGISTMKMN